MSMSCLTVSFRPYTDLDIRIARSDNTDLSIPVGRYLSDPRHPEFADNNTVRS